MLEFEFPDTGEGVTEGTFLEWLVEEGEEVEEDQPLAEVETDKAVVDVPSPAHGTIENLRTQPGDQIEVGEVMLEMDTGEEKTGAPKDKEEDEEPEETGETSDKDAGAERSLDGSDVKATPRVRKIADEENVDLDKLAKNADGRITEEDVRNYSPGEQTGTEDYTDVKATPSVRKLAREKGVELDNVEGSGRGGKITREDVEEAAEKDERTMKKETEEGKVEHRKMNGVERVMAEKMEESRFSAPHVTHIDRADVTSLVELRERKKDHFDVHLTYLPFVMKAAVVAMKEYPELNAEYGGDEIILKKHYDFNIAVDTERGLMIPVIEDVEEKNIVELAEAIEEKAGKAREKELSREELRSGTFSITNIGAIGGESFTPIINPPQVSILGVGEIKETAEVVDGEVKPRKTVKLSLSYDHRVVDGATGARFMNKIIEILEDPGELLMEMS